jgi:hypothetical protein
MFQKGKHQTTWLYMFKVDLNESDNIRLVNIDEV